MSEEAKTESKGAGQVVLVTGGSGFIAGHIIEDLFKSGLRVRATTRGDAKDKRLDYLRELAGKYNLADGSSPLEFVSCDISKDGAFEEVVKGCWGVVHVASPVNGGSAGRKDPQNFYVEPAVRGTLGLLKACQAAGVKRIVITSSVAILSPDPEKHGKVPYTEADSNKVANLTYDPYSLSKMKAEEASSKFLADVPEAERPRVVTIHPVCVWGPQQNNSVTSSNQIIKALVTGEYPLAPPLCWCPVDVRDVAHAHTTALLNDRANGRYIVSCPGAASMQTYAKWFKTKYPKLPIPTRRMPVWILRLVAKFDHRIEPSFVDWSTKLHSFDGSKIERELGFKYQYGFQVKDPNAEYDVANFPENLQKTLTDVVESFIKFGVIKEKK